jgi:plastocyanin
MGRPKRYLYRVIPVVDRTRRQVLAAGGTALAVSIAGCATGGSGDGTPTDSGGGATTRSETAASGLPMRVDVSMTSTPRIEFDPRLVQVAVGGTVVWTLDSGSHDTTAYHPETKPPRAGEPAPRRIPDDADPWASPTLSQVGATFEWTFETPGVYDYIDTEAVCTSHAMVGNVGRVVVGWPDPDGQPALEPPQDRLPSLVADNIVTLNERTRDLLADRPTTGDSTSDR